MQLRLERHRRRARHSRVGGVPLLLMLSELEAGEMGDGDRKDEIDHVWVGEGEGGREARRRLGLGLAVLFEKNVEGGRGFQENVSCVLHRLVLRADVVIVSESVRPRIISLQRPIKKNDCDMIEHIDLQYISFRLMADRDLILARKHVVPHLKLGFESREYF